MEDTAASLAVTLIAVFCAVIIAVGVGSGLWRGARKLSRRLDDWRWQRRVRRLVTDDDTWCPQCVEEIRAQMPKAHIVPLGRPLPCEKHAAEGGRTGIVQFGGMVEVSEFEPVQPGVVTRAAQMYRAGLTHGEPLSGVHPLPAQLEGLKVLYTQPITAESGGLN